jgi:hypothetical protein
MVALVVAQMWQPVAMGANWFSTGVTTVELRVRDLTTRLLIMGNFTNANDNGFALAA